MALPSDVLTATDAFEADDALSVGFGPELAATVADVRRAEAARFAAASPEEIVTGVLWKF
jgi:glutamine synthetase